MFTDPAQHLITAGYDLDDTSVDDLSVDDLSDMYLMSIPMSMYIDSMYTILQILRSLRRTPFVYFPTSQPLTVDRKVSFLDRFSSSSTNVPIWIFFVLSYVKFLTLASSPFFCCSALNLVLARHSFSLHY